MAASFIIEHLHQKLEGKQEAIAAWLAEYGQDVVPFFATSVDLRHSGHKIAPVDTNLFPAGWNVMSAEARTIATQHSDAYFARYYPHATHIALLPERHTRNVRYLDHVHYLSSIVAGMGGERDVVLYSDAVEETTELESASGHLLTYQPLSHLENPDLILLNNDLSAGAMDVLSAHDVPIIPSPELGWHTRSKAVHFDVYEDVVRAFGKAFDIDPWLLRGLHSYCANIDFKSQTGLECVALQVEKTLKRIAERYAQYGITDTPYVFIKADKGTYGMGIMTVQHADEVLQLNKKQRNKMHGIKEGTVSEQVLIQEGIPTIDTVGGNPAEPMVYMIGHQAVGCTFRVNNERDEKGNLNSRGMSFESACEQDTEARNEAYEICPIRGVIASMAALATHKEAYGDMWDI